MKRSSRRPSGRLISSRILGRIRRTSARRTYTPDMPAYRQNGAEGSTRRLIDVLVAEGIGGASLLDIGGGVGIVQLELLKAGLATSMDVDASGPYLQVAEAEAEELGFKGRTAYRHGDFVALAGEVDGADVVTLDRVICCYP